MVIMLCPNVIYCLILFTVTPLINLPDILTNSFYPLLRLKVLFILLLLCSFLGESSIKLDACVHFEHPWHSLLGFTGTLLLILK